MKTVMIIGAAGQDGSYMSEYLLSNPEYKVVGVVKYATNPYLGNLQNIINNPNFSLVYGDLTDANSIDGLIKMFMPDYLLNFGANSFVGVSWDMPRQVFETNAVGVLNCLEAIRKFKTDCRFFNAGSSEEMGDILYTPQDLNHPMRPRSPYGASKCAAHHLVKVYRESYGLYAIQCVSYNHESPRRPFSFVTRKITHAVTNIVAVLKCGIDIDQIIPLELGNIDSERDWSHAKDIVCGIWRAMNQEKYSKSWNGIPKEYIFSSNAMYTVKQFVDIAFKTAGLRDGTWVGVGKDAKYIVQRPPHTFPLVVVSEKFFRPADVNSLCGNNEFTIQDLGWQLEYSLETLIEEMVKHDENLDK